MTEDSKQPDHYSPIESPALAEILAYQIREVSVWRDLVNSGWVKGVAFDYRVTHDEGILVRGKNGVVFNDFLPMNWQVGFEENGAPAADYSSRIIAIDPRDLANDQYGLTILAHEAGHAIFYEEDVDAGNLRMNETFILRNNDIQSTVSELKAKPDDVARACALVKAHNTLLENDVRASDFGLPIAIKLGVDEMEYYDAVVYQSLAGHFNNSITVIFVAIKGATALQREDVVGDMYGLQPEKGRVNKSVLDVLDLQIGVTVEAIEESVRRILLQHSLDLLLKR